MTTPPNTHPWKRASLMALKLKEARKEAMRRYEKTSPVRNDEYRKLKVAEYAHNSYLKRKALVSQ